MTKHSPIIATQSPRSGSDAGALAPPVAGASATFTDRREPCPHHDSATADSCADCWGGFVDVGCETCGHVKPLNDDCVCERCHDASDLPVELYNLKYNLVPPSGWALAERAAVSK